MGAQAETYGFIKEFNYEGMRYSMHVVPFIIANNEDKKEYRLREGDFLVHLSDGLDTKSFSVFYGTEQPVWETNVSKIILDDDDLIEKIGFLIDDYYA